MPSLIPTYAAHHIHRGLGEYLATSFSLAEKATAASLREFLSDPDDGMFRGPYARTRLPYAAAENWDGILGWLPEWFTPYHHQAHAFARLASWRDGQPRTPEPTLVVTGTGSGKTESFLYPILDHCRRDTRPGIKALILYPMNALANDQAARLATLITGDPALAGIRAGLYTGEAEGNRTVVSEAGLITDRDTLRDAPPDILLTNYKMLDQLLLRDADATLWQTSATTLQYIALDEFHTYDGAQGTDVALLLRRLGLRLKALQPDGFLTADEQARPLGRITPVATSATLGDRSDESAATMLDFAHTIFGHRPDATAIVRETTETIEQWRQSLAAFLGGTAPATASRVLDDAALTELVRTVNDAIAAATDANDDRLDHGEIVHRVFCDHVFGHAGTDDQPAEPCSRAIDDAVLAASASPIVAKLLAATARPRPLPAIAADVLGTGVARHLGTGAEEFIAHALTELAHLRAEFGHAHGRDGKKFPGVDTHLWVREVSRVDRRVELDAAGADMFRWSDDGTGNTGAGDQWLPACYCRNCGRSGWMTAVDAGGEFIETSAHTIRRGSLNHPNRQRPLIDATSEVGHGNTRHGDSAVYWLDVVNAQLRTTQPDDEDLERGGIVPVLTYAGEDTEEHAREERCPSCGEADSIRYLGSSVATLLSVAMSNLFGMDDLDDADKKSLIFVDSVQDAAHRAGFMQARARTFAFRTRTKSVVDHAVRLNELPDLLMNSADTDALPDRARFELLPPWVATSDRFTSYWDPEATADARRNATGLLRRVLETDLALEFGARADLPRSLVSTGSLSIAVAADDDVLHRATESLGLDDLRVPVDRDSQLAWARGILERMRLKGAVSTDLLQPFINYDGNPYLLRRREATGDGMPRFSWGGEPQFPRVGPAPTSFHQTTAPLASRRSWYARWTADALGIGRHDAANMVTRLFEKLAEVGVLTATTTNSGATTYAIPPENIVVAPGDGDEILECGVCHLRLSTDTHGRELLAGAPCLSLDCAGSFTIADNPDNYYRRMYGARNTRTVIADEHTSLLDTGDRLTLENQFKGTVEEQAPNAPNVLVATPTLEMGIDIGDLSTVMLASLPGSVSSYVQRVGRAGRLTGNSLIVALVRGRGMALAQLMEPEAMIDGTVEPPAAFLSAREILHRQFTAHLIDSIDFAAAGVHPTTARTVFAVGTDRTVVDVIQERIKEGLDSALDDFIGSLGIFAPDDVAAELRRWATGDFAGELDAAREQWNADRALLCARRDELGESLHKLMEEQASAAADDDTQQRYRSTRTAYHATKRRLSEQFDNQFWIAALEQFGLLPNFTLIDDNVDFFIDITKYDPDTHEFVGMPRNYRRGVSSALHELAPGAHFYAQGIAAKVDSVELGPDNSEVHEWRVCPDCSHSEILAPVHPDGPAARAGTCPHCGSAKYSDRGQVLKVVEMSKVYATVDSARSAITDDRDERSHTRFETALSMVIPPGGVGPGWFLENTGFGVQFLPRVELRWLNLGRAVGSLKQRLVGQELEASLFRVCAECGHRDAQAGTNHWRDHRRWCPLRNAPDENSVQIALGRTLTTQGVLLHVPPTISAADDTAVTSLIAALRLGFKKRLGGNPDHLDVAVVHTSTHGRVTPKLLLHDTVPGGTGYLSQFTRADDIRALLEATHRELEECECARDDRLACPKCLLPYAAPSGVEHTSRESALAAITKILADDIHPEPDVAADPRARSWDGHVRDDIPEQSDRSQLEAMFLEQLRADLKGMEATVREETVDNHARWTITIPGSSFRWLMEEQKDFGRTRPDFYFETDRANVRKIAVYLDGAAYHASTAHNSVVSDVDKRNWLTDQGILPWSMTMADINARRDTVNGTRRTAPDWYNPELREAINNQLTLSDTQHKLLTDDPMTQLLAILGNPDEQWHKVGLAAAFQANLNSLLGTAPFGPLINLRKVDHAFHLRFTIEDGVPDTDRWAWFLSLSNLFRLAPESTVIEAADTSTPASPAPVSASDTAAASPTAASTAETPTADTAVATTVAASTLWREVRDEFDGDSDAEAAIAALIDVGAVDPDSYGEEIGGSPTIVMWNDARIALVFPGDEDLFGAAADAGWTIIDADAITAGTIPDTLIHR